MLSDLEGSFPSYKKEEIEQYLAWWENLKILDNSKLKGTGKGPKPGFNA